mmetsp:Transcript_5579/g.15636  ORF Transcript_5579/g.15636 Transcript_5579/m.15636 type:complete len:255 (-) Transcript_5579:1127-1891(-)
MSSRTEMTIPLSRMFACHTRHGFSIIVRHSDAISVSCVKTVCTTTSGNAGITESNMLRTRKNNENQYASALKRMMRKPTTFRNLVSPSVIFCGYTLTAQTSRARKAMGRSAPTNAKITIVVCSCPSQHTTVWYTRTVETPLGWSTQCKGASTVDTTEMKNIMNVTPRAPTKDELLSRNLPPYLIITNPTWMTQINSSMSTKRRIFATNLAVGLSSTRQSRFMSSRSKTKTRDKLNNQTRWSGQSTDTMLTAPSI